MAKQQWKPGNMLYPLPAVMVSVRDNEGKDNIITVAWQVRCVPTRRWYPFRCGRSAIRII